MSNYSTRDAVLEYVRTIRTDTYKEGWSRGCDTNPVFQTLWLTSSLYHRRLV